MCVQAVGTELQGRAEVLSQLEADSQALAQFVSSGEAARIKARLTQIGRYWEELRESVQQLDGQLEESSSHQQKFKTSLETVSKAEWNTFRMILHDHTSVIFIVTYRSKHLLVSCMQNWNNLSNPAPPHQRPTKLFKTTWYSVTSSSHYASYWTTVIFLALLLFSVPYAVRVTVLYD